MSAARAKSDLKECAPGLNSPEDLPRPVENYDKIFTEEEIDAQLAFDRQRFEDGYAGAWLPALITARLAGRQPPAWAWHYVIEAIAQWGAAENTVRLEDLLYLQRKGHASARRIKHHEGSISLAAKQLETERPGCRKAMGSEAFWLEVARIAQEKYGAPPVGWEKARQMERNWRALEKRIAQAKPPAWAGRK